MKRKLITPNTPLPKGATLIKVIQKTFGCWVKMEYDAKVISHKITWYRVKNGMSGKGDREDWVADVPMTCISVHDYQWREPRSGMNKYNSFTDATRIQLEEGIVHYEGELQKLLAKAFVLRKSIATLKRSVATVTYGQDQNRAPRIQRRTSSIRLSL